MKWGRVSPVCMVFNPKDRFFHKAKADGFLARSAYKLEELQQKYKIIRSGDLILDLGAAPGSWSQVAMKIIGPSGRVVGLDLKPIELSAPNAKFYVMNAFDFDPIILEGRTQIDVLLSDMAHNTTGIRSVDQARSFELCQQILKISDEFLKPKGNVVMKVFEGPDAEKISKEISKKFEVHNRFKPEAVRKGSYETYFVGLNKRA